MAAVPIRETVDWIASFPNWNMLFSTPDGIPILKILLTSVQSGRMERYPVRGTVSFGLLSLYITASIEKIRAVIVAQADPATPK